jgi:hypothetical protein
VILDVLDLSVTVARRLGFDGAYARIRELADREQWPTAADLPRG